MVFNSIEFLYFFLVVYTLYILLNHRWQNVLLLVASYFFYGWWDWRFLSLLWISTILDFWCAINIEKAGTKKLKRLFLIFSMVGNLGMLGFFKYAGFFYESAASFLSFLGLQINPWSLKIILPLGISFYTFQTMSYTIDVYRGQLKPTKNLLDFALFVSFFPQLVAGPIERARNLIPQIQQKRIIDQGKLVEGIYLICLGLLKKIIIADNLAGIVNRGFAAYSDGGWLDTLISIHAFGLQIYGDFSGYSDIARGTAKMMGFELMLNFDVPLMSPRIPDFWQRWHISLSTWVRDYVFKSLGRTGGRWRVQLNTILAMTLMGLWHGANWTFIAWGFYFGVIQVLYSIYKKLYRTPKNLPKWRNVLSSIAGHVISAESFFLAGLLFRSRTLTDAWLMFKRLFCAQEIKHDTLQNLMAFFVFTAPLFIEGVVQYRSGDPLFYLRWGKRTRFIVFLAVLAYVGYVYLFGANVKGGEEFIYFQF